MRCKSCGVENPPHAAYCLGCGNQLVIEQSTPATPTRQFVAAQAQSAMRKMLETPGTIVLGIGVLTLLISVVLMIAGQWSGLGLFAVSVMVLFVAILVRGHEARIVEAQASIAPTVLQSEIREREIIKVKCRYCGTLNPEAARKCESCGALI